MISFNFREYVVGYDLKPDIVKSDIADMIPSQFTSSFVDGKYARQLHMQFTLDRDDDIHIFNYFVSTSLINNLLVSVNTNVDTDNVGTENSSGVTDSTWFNGFINRVRINKNLEIYNLVAHSDEHVSSAKIKDMSVEMIIEEIDQKIWDKFVG